MLEAGAAGDPKTLWNYLRPEKWTLVVIAITGILYNVGMTAGPWYEGKLAQCLYDILGGSRPYGDMISLAGSYVLTVAAVQLLRFLKRLYVRRFANHLNRSMKQTLYGSLVHKGQTELEKEGVGALMTKAITDVDTCVEGIRKFVTEIFDTGVVMIAYFGMLLCYDWRLTLLTMAFPPVAYVIANLLKKVVTRSAYAYKEATGRLNERTYDRVGNGLTYRIFGAETQQDACYEEALSEYEKKAVRANVWENAMQPVYQVISMMGAVCILWFGGKNVLGSGWTAWDLAAFVTFLSCFTKLAVKSSKAAKLFNSVQKAQVSWARIKPLLPDGSAAGRETEKTGRLPAAMEPILSVTNLTFGYPDSPLLLSGLTFSARAGDMVGVTGPVACGKTTLGKLLLSELPYEGSIDLNGDVTYMGHEPELICGTIAENVLLGSDADPWQALSWVKMDGEVREMPDGIATRLGNGGVTLSGGQQDRIALARTLLHRKALLVLDDPFSAVDMQTERQIFDNLRLLTRDRAVLLISHRLSLFPEMDRVIWLDGGKAIVSDHAHLMEDNPRYAALYRSQTSGSGEDEK